MIQVVRKTATYKKKKKKKNLHIGMVFVALAMIRMLATNLNVTRILVVKKCEIPRWLEKGTKYFL